MKKNCVLFFALLFSCNDILVAQNPLLQKDESQAPIYDISSMPFNTAVSEFCPMFYLDGIIFSSNVSIVPNSTRVKEGDFNYYYLPSLTSSEFPQKLKGDINTKYDEVAIIPTSDSNHLMFGRNKRLNREDTQTPWGIYVAEKDDNGAWQTQNNFRYNNPAHHVAQPALAPNNTMFFFVSDMPGGFGGTDIYMCRFNGKGWTVPINLGAKVNTKGDEMFPFMHQDGVLYFASNGHKGAGGLDVFATRLENNEDWAAPYHLSEPFNSESNDFGFILSPDKKTAFLSSDRKGGKGKDDIYRFDRREQTFVQNSEALAENPKTDTHPAVRRTPIPRFGSHSRNIPSVQEQPTPAPTPPASTQPQEEPPAKTPEQLQYKEEPNYAQKVIRPQQEPFAIPDMPPYADAPTHGNTATTTAHKNVNLNYALRMDKISFAPQTWQITGETAEELDIVLDYMRTNSDLYIQIASYTDSRGEDSYNLELSRRRASAAKDYLVEKGIAAERLVAKGYGEAKPLNDCLNGVNCDEEKHDVNNRIEVSLAAKNTLAADEDHDIDFKLATDEEEDKPVTAMLQKKISGAGIAQLVVGPYAVIDQYTLKTCQSLEIPVRVEKDEHNQRAIIGPFASISEMQRVKALAEKRGLTPNIDLMSGKTPTTGANGKPALTTADATFPCTLQLGPFKHVSNDIFYRIKQATTHPIRLLHLPKGTFVEVQKCNSLSEAQAEVDKLIKLPDVHQATISYVLGNEKTEMMTDKNGKVKTHKTKVK